MRTVVLGLAWLTCLAICRADELASVTGLVTDPNGRSVPGRAVLITNLATNVTSKTVTNDQGIYRVPALEPGIYRMTVDKDGFKVSSKAVSNFTSKTSRRSISNCRLVP
jgi:protocatechuate 3,4-dioxygenase beta subunit